jgi:hypothetical protein
MSAARWTKELVSACARRSAAARQAGQRLAAPSNGVRAALAELAAAHVEARQLARAACESARAAGGLAPDLLTPALKTELERAETSWKSAPPVASATPLRGDRD